MLSTGPRRICNVSHTCLHSEPEPGTMAANESDSNADTCCLGKNFIILNHTNQTADVFPYEKSYQPIANVPIVSGATAWDDPIDGTTYILVFHEALFYGTKLDHSLINPNQIRYNGIDFWDNPYDCHHNTCIEVHDGPTIPLTLDGTKIAFTSRTPTTDELNSCIHINMTSDEPWNPTTVRLGEISTLSTPPVKRLARCVATTYSNTHPMSNDMDSVYEYDDNFQSDSILHSIEPSLVELKERMIQAINVDAPITDDIPSRKTFISSERHNKLCADKIADLWGVGRAKAVATLKATTIRNSSSQSTLQS